MKKFKSIVLTSVLVLGAVCGMKAYNGNNVSNKLLESNVESLASGDGYVPDIRKNYYEGTITTQGKTIPCCVYRNPDDSCDYNKTDCLSRSFN